MINNFRHGKILGGAITVPDLEMAVKDYRDILGMTMVSQNTVASDLARSWGCPQNAEAKMAVLQPNSGFVCFVRLIEQPDHNDFKPTRSYGWAAYEFTVQNVFDWPGRLKNSGFDVVGLPKKLEGLPYFVPMQVLGPGRELIYLNEVFENTPTSDLPKAQSLTDQIFIVVLAAQDRQKTLDWYLEKLQLDEGETHRLAYRMINNAFGFPADTMTLLTMVQNQRLPIVEVDGYPKQARTRPRHDGMLPPGNALVSLGVNNLDALDLDWITPPIERLEPPYSGRRAACTIGPDGELLELIENGQLKKSAI